MCYGVEAREKLPDTDPNTLLAAKQHERLRTRNPRDPAFYSSCMMFTKDVTWMPLPGAIAQENLTADVGLAHDEIGFDPVRLERRQQVSNR